MQKAVECYDYIHVVGQQLANVISLEIEPLLVEGKFEEAKDVVRDYYEPSRWGRGHDVIFIEYDMILANINRRIRLSQND